MPGSLNASKISVLAIMVSILAFMSYGIPSVWRQLIVIKNLRNSGKFTLGAWRIAMGIYSVGLGAAIAMVGV